MSHISARYAIAAQCMRIPSQRGVAVIYLALTLCVIVLALIVYRYDMYEREPWYMLLLAAVLGGVSAWAIGFVEDALIRDLGQDGNSVLWQSSIASVCEESCKLAIVLFIFFCFSTHFNDPMDGIVYGAFAGVGFAVFESIFYISLFQQTMPEMTWQALFGQETIRLVLHLLTGGMVGFGFGLLKYRVPYARFILPTWLAASVGIHFLWDFACGLPAEGTFSPLFLRSVAILLMLFAAGLFAVAVIVANSWSRTIHARNHIGQRLLGWPFTLLIKPDDAEVDNPGIG